MRTTSLKAVAATIEPLTADQQRNVLERFSAPEWTELGITLRMAAGLTGKTKDELIDIVRQAPEEILAIEKGLDDAMDGLCACIELCEMAKPRLRIAAHVFVAGKDDLADIVVPIRPGLGRLRPRRPSRSKRP